jgi:hypothetical protein
MTNIKFIFWCMLLLVLTCGVWVSGIMLAWHMGINKGVSIPAVTAVAIWTFLASVLMRKKEYTGTEKAGGYVKATTFLFICLFVEFVALQTWSWMSRHVDAGIIVAWFVMLISAIICIRFWSRFAMEREFFLARMEERKFH